MAKPTIAIILGAAATTEHYASLCSALEAKGYPTACGDPPSITVEDATIVTIQDDVDFVRSKVLAPLLAEGKDVVVVAHSYGGGYGAAALEGLSKRERTKKGEEGGVVGVIYLAAFCIDPGESTLQALEMDPSNPKPGIAPGVRYFRPSSNPQLKYLDRISRAHSRSLMPNHSGQVCRTTRLRCG